MQIFKPIDKTNPITTQETCVTICNAKLEKLNILYKPIYLTVFRSVATILYNFAKENIY